MTIEKKSAFNSGKPVIDLTGPDGNAFVLLAIAQKWANELGMDSDAIMSEMKSGDYEHLVSTFDENFGDYCTILR